MICTTERRLGSLAAMQVGGFNLHICVLKRLCIHATMLLLLFLMLCVCACMLVCMRECLVCVFVCACVHACTGVGVMTADYAGFVSP